MARKLFDTLWAKSREASAKLPVERATEAPRRRGRFVDRTMTSPLALALEPRFMFDAAGVATGSEAAIDAAAQAVADLQTDNPQTEDQRDPLAEALSATVPPADRTEVVFVDARIHNVDVLLAGVHPAAEVVMLDTAIDGLSQMAAYMAGRSDVDAIHIISHGREGGVSLGGMNFDLTAIDARGADLAIIGAAMAQGGDILLYGCDTGDGTDGRAFIEALAAATGADVAASIDDTGHSDIGGDWDLEAATGVIETEIVVDAAAQAAFQGRLATITVNTLTDELDGSITDGDISLRDALAQAEDGDIINFDTTVFGSGGVINLTEGQLVITKSVTIDGDVNGDGSADVTIDAQDGSRVFDVDDGDNDAEKTVVIDSLAITNGNAGNGGGIRNFEDLTLINSTVSGSRAS